VFSFITKEAYLALAVDIKMKEVKISKEISFIFFKYNISNL
jgi:hypothetical protein